VSSPSETALRDFVQGPFRFLRRPLPFIPLGRCPPFRGRVRAKPFTPWRGHAGGDLFFCFAEVAPAFF